MNKQNTAQEMANLADLVISCTVFVWFKLSFYSQTPKYFPLIVGFFHRNAHIYLKEVIIIIIISKYLFLNLKGMVHWKNDLGLKWAKYPSKS